MSVQAHTAPTVTTRTHAISATDWSLLILRLALAAIFIAHGGQKVFGWFGGQGLAATAQSFSNLGISAPFAYLAAFTEFFGGVAVLIGVLSRLASLGLATVMLVAVYKIHWANGFFLSDQGFEYNLALFAMSLALILAGPGRLALADWEACLWSKRAEEKAEEKEAESSKQKEAAA